MSAGGYKRRQARAWAGTRANSECPLTAPTHLPYRITSWNAQRMSIDVPAAFVRLLEGQMSMNPRVSYHTAPFTVRFVPVPVAGTVFAGLGAVWENPTRGLPVSNPTGRQNQGENLGETCGPRGTHTPRPRRVNMQSAKRNLAHVARLYGGAPMAHHLAPSGSTISNSVIPSVGPIIHPGICDHHFYEVGCW